MGGATIAEQLERVAQHPAAGERLEGERADELAAGARQEDLQFGALGEETARQLGRLVGGDRAGDPQGDQTSLEAALGHRPPRDPAPASSRDVPPIPTALADGRQALSW